MRGFTLIELLVVVLIVGLGIAVISINVGGNNSYKLRMEAKQFANQTGLMAEEAVLANQQWGVDVFRQPVDGAEQFGYRWLVRSEDGIWELPYTEEFSKEYTFSPGIGLRLQLDGLDAEQDIEFKQKVAKRTPEWKAAQARQRDKIIDDDNSIAKQQQLTPDIWLLSSGEMNAFVLTVFDRENPEAYVEVKGDELGRVTLVEEQANE